MRRPPNYLKLVERTHFVPEDADPDLEYICRVIISEGLSPSEIVDTIEQLSNGRVRMSYLTIFKWLEGRVRRPHNHSLVWVGRALGLRREWVRDERQ